MNAPAFTPLPLDEQHRLVLRNQGLVRHIAKQIAGTLPFEEKVSLGNLGMIIAAQRYDPMRCVGFATYAGWWVRAYILKGAIMESGVPDNRYGRKVFFGVRKAIRDIEQAGLTATDERVAKALDVPLDRVVNLRERALQADSHIDAMYDESALLGLISAGLMSDANPERDAIAADDAIKGERRLKTMLQKLKPREREVIERRYMNERCDTLTEIGNDWGLSRERVRQIEAMAFRKLRPMMIAGMK